MAWIPAVAGAAAAASSGRRYNGSSRLGLVVLIGIALLFLAIFAGILLPIEGIGPMVPMFAIAAVVIGIGVIFTIILVAQNYERRIDRSEVMYRRRYPVQTRPIQPMRQTPARREYEHYPPELYCRVCGESINSDAVFCPHCGNNINF